MEELEGKYIIDQTNENLAIVTKKDQTELRGSIIYLYGMGSTIKRNLDKMRSGEFVFPDGFRVLIPDAPLRMNKTTQ